ncbi:MAG: dihydropteroate synthase [Dokdonella sp.]
MPARPPQPLEIGGRSFAWGSRTYVMGIINVTPDSFSGDGLMSAGADPVAAAVAQAEQMAAEGADLLDIGGQSTRPGHAQLSVEAELARVVPVVAAVRKALPQMTLSIDTTAARVAEAALDAGAHLINDVWGTAAEPELLALAAERQVPLVLMHNRAEARYVNLVAEVIADLQRAVDTAMAAGIAWERLIVDPGIGFGKTPAHNLALLHDLAALQVLARPILLGASRKSTIGKVLDLPADQRVEGTVATTALGVAANVDIVRVHDVQANVRAARMADAIVRGGWHEQGAANK